MDQEQLDDGTAVGAECTRCGALLVPGTTATGTDRCARCVYGPELDWTDLDEEIPPQCVGCGAAIVPTVTALPPGTPGRRERCQDCAALGECAGCGDLILPGYNDLVASPTARLLCRDCAPPDLIEGDVLVLTDAIVPDDAYDSRDTIL